MNRTATVFYVQPNSAQIDQINRDGWDSELGKAYMSARYNEGGQEIRASAACFGMIVAAAYVRVETQDPELVWAYLQNGVPSNGKVEVIESFIPADKRRSMDVGDYIVWDDGKRERVAPVGFVVESD